MNYAEIKKLDVANGKGIRISLFVSGCRNNCPGCFNKEAQDFNYGKPFTFATWDYILDLLKPDYVAGLSVLGGDPMEPENQKELLPFLRRVKETYPQKPIWMWTGYRYEKIWQQPILHYVDVLVDGPFVEALADKNLAFMGSKNQRVLHLDHTCGSCYWYKDSRCWQCMSIMESWVIKDCWRDKEDAD